MHRQRVNAKPILDDGPPKLDYDNEDNLSKKITSLERLVRQVADGQKKMLGDIMHEVSEFKREVRSLNKRLQEVDEKQGRTERAVHGLSSTLHDTVSTVRAPEKQVVQPQPRNAAPILANDRYAPYPSRGGPRDRDPPMGKSKPPISLSKSKDKQLPILFD
eukprot:TRINITY_DN10278_c0_g2_i2.p1 TRINITY_DN10278_c0_g2~~TRINITY_DN10278_c0_g2_i2.p1  ORF type:complete len:161 (+),score=25.22 TRINITY_DN10278_c0_g2_i2:47-529(+)